MPAQWDLSSPAFVVKTARAETIAPEIRAIVREVAPEAPMYRAYTMAFLADAIDARPVVHHADAGARVRCSR